jgi:hypothetical protein
VADTSSGGSPPGVFCCTFSFDVTAIYNQFKNSVFTHLGFRLHDPSVEWASFAGPGLFSMPPDWTFSLCPEVSADIDIRPANGSDHFNPKSHGVVRVAILTTSSLRCYKRERCPLSALELQGRKPPACTRCCWTSMEIGTSTWWFTYATRKHEFRVARVSLCSKGKLWSGEAFRGTGVLSYGGLSRAEPPGAVMHTGKSRPHEHHAAME